NVLIFDRSRQPVMPTDAGKPIIEKARVILQHVKELEHITKDFGKEISGEVRIGIIPTIAPYLVHLVLPTLSEKYPKLKIKLYEWNTTQIVESLMHNRIDIGIAATPLNLEEIKELPIFYEELVIYSAENKKPNNKK